MNRVVDRLIGTRLKAAIARRVRREVSLQRSAWSADQSSLMKAEVSRQLTDLGQVRTAAERDLRVQVAEEVRRQLSEQPISEVEFSVGLLLGAGRRLDRTLTPARWRVLTTEIATLAGGGNPDWQMRTAYRTLVDQETRGLGRIAGSTDNIIGKLTVPLFLEPPDGPVLEIGTLFGLFSPALLKQFRQVGQFRSLTVVDPLAGHQIQPGLDHKPDPTGTPVTAQTAVHNFAVGGLGDDEVRVVEGFSTDESVRARVADQQYAVVVIDGDHSEEGVYADLGWLETVTDPGGIVVMDDYGDSLWPGVERATRRHLADGGRLQFLGTASTSAYLRMPAV